MAKIQYKTYSFNSPPLITSNNYLNLKKILTEKPGININPPTSFIENFKVELVYLGICLTGLLIASLELAEWFDWVGAISGLLAFGSLFSFVPSLFSYLGFISDKSSYYSRLKRDIIKSSNYTEFLKLRNIR